MKVGDLVLIENIATGETRVERITSGCPSSGLFTSESGIPFWASGIQWTPDIGPHETKKKEYACKVIK